MMLTQGDNPTAPQTCYIHSLEYIRLRQSGVVEKRPDGRYYRTGTEIRIVVNDGVPVQGFHDAPPDGLVKLPPKESFADDRKPS